MAKRKREVTLDQVMLAEVEKLRKAVHGYRRVLRAMAFEGGDKFLNELPTGRIRYEVERPHIEPALMDDAVIAWLQKREAEDASDLEAEIRSTERKYHELLASRS